MPAPPSADHAHLWSIRRVRIRRPSVSLQHPSSGDLRPKSRRLFGRSSNSHLVVTTSPPSLSFDDNDHHAGPAPPAHPPHHHSDAGRRSFLAKPPAPGAAKRVLTVLNQPGRPRRAVVTPAAQALPPPPSPIQKLPHHNQQHRKTMSSSSHLLSAARNAVSASGYDDNDNDNDNDNENGNNGNDEDDDESESARHHQQASYHFHNRQKKYPPHPPHPSPSSSSSKNNHPQSRKRHSVSRPPTARTRRSEHLPSHKLRAPSPPPPTPATTRRALPVVVERDEADDEEDTKFQRQHQHTRKIDVDIDVELEDDTTHQHGDRAVKHVGDDATRADSVGSSMPSSRYLPVTSPPSSRTLEVEASEISDDIHSAGDPKSARHHPLSSHSHPITIMDGASPASFVMAGPVPKTAAPRAPDAPSSAPQTATGTHAVDADTEADTEAFFDSDPVVGVAFDTVGMDEADIPDAPTASVSASVSASAVNDDDEEVEERGDDQVGDTNEKNAVSKTSQPDQQQGQTLTQQQDGMAWKTANEQMRALQHALSVSDSENKALRRRVEELTLQHTNDAALIDSLQARAAQTDTLARQLRDTKKRYARRVRDAEHQLQLKEEQLAAVCAVKPPSERRSGGSDIVVRPKSSKTNIPGKSSSSSSCASHHHHQQQQLQSTRHSMSHSFTAVPSSSVAAVGRANSISAPSMARRSLQAQTQAQTQAQAQAHGHGDMSLASVIPDVASVHGSSSASSATPKTMARRSLIRRAFIAHIQSPRYRSARMAWVEFFGADGNQISYEVFARAMRSLAVAADARDRDLELLVDELCACQPQPSQQQQADSSNGAAVVSWPMFARFYHKTKSFTETP